MPSDSTVFTVDTEAVAQLFRKPLEIERLLLFLPGLSVSEFAKASGLKFHAAYRKVQSLRAAGLLVEIAQRSRGGKAIKVYRCPYQTFFIPERLISISEQLEQVFSPLYRLMQHRFAELATHGAHPVGGMLFTIRPQGLWLLPATAEGTRWHPTPTSTPALHTSGPLHLNFQEARQLEEELIALFDRYRACRGPHTYLLHQFLTPVEVQRDQYVFPHAGYTRFI